MSGVNIHASKTCGTWAECDESKVGGCRVSAFSGAGADGSTILEVCPGDVRIKFQGSDSDVIAEWGAMRAKIYGCGPTIADVGSAIDRCRAALADEEATDAGDAV